MVNKTFNIPLDLKVPSASYDVEVVEGDNGNIFVITLTDDGDTVDLSGCKVLAVFSRPDGATVQQDTDGHGITVGGDHDNIVTIDLYTSSFRPGTVVCELQVYSGAGQDTLVTSAQFTFQCCRSIMNDDTILSEEKYPILVGLISQVTELAARTGDMTKAVYDSDNDGKVDDSEKLGGHASDYFATAERVSSLEEEVDAYSSHASRHATGGADPTVFKWSRTLDADEWTDGIIDLTLPVTEDNVILIQGATDDDRAAFTKAKISVSHIAGGIRLTADAVPEVDISLNIAAI